MLLAVTVDKPNVGLVAPTGVTAAPFNSNGEPATNEVIKILPAPSTDVDMFFSVAFPVIAVLIAVCNFDAKSAAVVAAAAAEVIVTPFITTVAVSPTATGTPAVTRDT
jgi:peptidoglycan/LPS O-acetylase OafA/YrhL